MLRSMRSHAKTIVSKIILALLIASFAVWGIGDMIVARPEQAEVARVGKVAISRLAVENEMQRDVAQLRQRLGEQYKPEFLQMLNIPQQVANRMVAQELMRQETKALGVIPSDHMVADVLRTDKNFHNADGKFDKKKFLRILRQNGMAERDFVALMRDDIARRLLSQTVSGNFAVQDMAVKIMQAAAKEQRDVVVYRIAKPSDKVADPTDKELEAYYNSVSDRYTIPEYRQISYVTIDEGHVEREFNITSEELKQLYEERAEEFKIPENRDIELLLYTGKDHADQAKEMLVSGKSIKEVSKALPPVNAVNTEMKAVGRGRLPEALEQVIFSLGIGEVSQPIAGDFGFHVVKVAGVNEGKIKLFSEVKDGLRDELRANRSSELLTKKADALEDSLAGGSTLAEAAKELGLTMQKVEAFSKQGSTPDGRQAKLPDLKNFVPLAFSVNEGEASSISLGRAGVYYLVQADKVIAEQLQPIAEVKSELIKSWKQSKRSTMRMKHAADVAGKLADPKQREAALTSGDVKRLVSGKLSRQNLKLSGINLPTDMVQSIFATDVGGVTRSSQLPDGRYAVALVNAAHMPPLKDTLDDEAKQLRASMQTNQQQELMQQLMAHLYEKYNVEINQDILALISAN